MKEEIKELSQLVRSLTIINILLRLIGMRVDSIRRYGEEISIIETVQNKYWIL
mgnify:CR=1 FL=1